MPKPALPHASERVEHWAAAWKERGQIVLLLDFDGTLAPIVERPDEATMLPASRRALERLLGCPGVVAAVVSGRGLADARRRAGLPDIAYAGNHGMEIEGPGMHRIHEEAAAARPKLEAVASRVSTALSAVEGALVEDKGLTLSVHYRRVARPDVGRVRRLVMEAAGEHEGLRVTEGKEVLEIRPAVDWHKGRAVEFLLGQLDPADGVPVLYLGDDTTDEDAFQTLRAWRGGAGEGVLVAEAPPQATAASSLVRDPQEVGELLTRLAERMGC